MARNSRRNLRRQCSFCYNTTNQFKLILHATLLRLRRMLQERRYTHQMAHNNQQREGNHEVMRRLIITLFQNNQCQLQISKNCEHVRIKNWLTNRLGCIGQKVSIMINDLCDRVARRNYELHIMSSQIKNVQSSVFQNGDQLLLQKKQQKNSRQKPSQEQQVKEQQIEKRSVLNQQSLQIYEQPVEIPIVSNVPPQMVLTYNLPHNGVPFTVQQNGLSLGWPQNQIPLNMPQNELPSNFRQNQIAHPYNFLYRRP